jgi:hypothetical protein
MRRLVFTGIIFSLFFVAPLPAQEFGFAQQGFGFGDDEEAVSDNGGGGAGFGAAMGAGNGITIGGEVSASMVGYIDDFSDGPDHVEPGDIFSGKLNFSAKSSIAEWFINLKLAPGLVYYDKKSPVYVDEAYIRAYFGNFDIEAGLRKLSWGKADSFGPLDVINPLDSSAIYPEMTDNSGLMDVKIPRPMVHLSWRPGEFSKLEGVFIPNFEPHRFDQNGRWAPAKAGSLASAPPAPSLDYAQAGLRFTTTAGSSDVGMQYYYGRLPLPAVKLRIDPSATPPGISAELLYNRYHQIGLDYAQVVFGFNIRSEFAANITEDPEGGDGSVYNPSLAWSLGFDRDLFLGINLNAQIDETIRLMDSKVGSADVMSGSFDIEGGTEITATRIMATLSRKFLRDELELRAAAIWGVENRDFVIMPALVWTRDALTVACSGGIFGGDETGQLGQYHKNNFVKLGITYTGLVR